MKINYRVDYGGTLTLPESCDTSQAVKSPPVEWLSRTHLWGEKVFRLLYAFYEAAAYKRWRKQSFKIVCFPSPIGLKGFARVEEEGLFVGFFQHYCWSTIPQKYRVSSGSSSREDDNEGGNFRCAYPVWYTDFVRKLFFQKKRWNIVYRISCLLDRWILNDLNLFIHNDPIGGDIWKMYICQTMWNKAGIFRNIYMYTYQFVIRTSCEWYAWIKG